MAASYIILPKPTDLLASRLWRNVVMLPSGCWEWSGKVKTEKGYGFFMFERQNLRTHRVAYLLYYLTDPKELFVCHTCDNPPCCNPFHLFLGTARNNTDDKIAKGRQTRGTHFTDERTGR